MLKWPFFRSRGVVPITVQTQKRDLISELRDLNDRTGIYIDCIKGALEKPESIRRANDIADVKALARLNCNRIQQLLDEVKP